MTGRRLAMPAAGPECGTAETRSRASRDKGADGPGGYYECIGRSDATMDKYQRVLDSNVSSGGYPWGMAPGEIELGAAPTCQGGKRGDAGVIRKAVRCPEGIRDARISGLRDCRKASDHFC